MTMTTWVRRWSASAASVCVALASSGCSRIITQARNYDVLVSSERKSSPTNERAYSAEISVDAGQPITVHAFQQEQCKVTEHQVFDRTVITDKHLEKPQFGLGLGILGLTSIGAGAYAAVHELERDDQKDFRVAIGLGAAGTALLGLAGVEMLRAGGKSREHVGLKELVVERGHAPCGTKTPVSEAAVKLVGSQHQGVTFVSTDTLGKAVIPEDEVAKLDAPVDVYVNGTYVGRNSAALQRGQAAAAKVREKLAREEELEREKRAREELRIAQEQHKARTQRAAAFRKSVKVGDTSHCGLVVEVKSPVVKLQTMVGERWLKIEQLYAEGDAPCRFFNGVYQDP